MDSVLKIVKMMNRSKLGIIKSILHLYLRVVYACDIMPDTNIGDGTRFPHRGLGVVINNNAIIGKNCIISKGVVIGGRNGNRIVPSIGDNVLIGANAVVLGAIKVGKDVSIGALCVVTHDIPDGATVVGNPAKIIKIYGDPIDKDTNLK